MNSFSRIITLLRKEKGITQKQAAADLGISQALLSHYEKGLRECGLDFLIKLCDYTIVSDLRECHFGEFEGRTFQELMTIDPNFARWLDPNSGYQPVGGEASADFAERIVLALDQVFMDMMRNGIHEASAVTHGGVIVLLLSMLAFPRKNPGEWTTDNGCGFTISTTPEMWTRDRAVEVTQILPIGYDFSESELNRFRKNKGPDDE